MRADASGVESVPPKVPLTKPGGEGVGVLLHVDALFSVAVDKVLPYQGANLGRRLWPSVEIMRTSIMQGASVADIALPSYEDEAAHFGDADPEACAARYRDAGAVTLAVKDGARPVLVVHEGAARRVVPVPVEPVDSTAAGDAFNAAFLIALAQGDSPDAAAARGCALSAKVIAQRGALVAV